jgi:hypothetical protein
LSTELFDEDFPQRRAETKVLSEAELLVLLSRVTGLSATTTTNAVRGKELKPNDYGVSYRLYLPGQSSAPCTGPDAAEPQLTVANALVHAIKNACKELCLPEPVELSRGTAPSAEAELAPTAAELDYLTEFLERHAAPETVTVEMADAELRAGRAAQAEQGGRDAAGTSTCRAAQPSAMALLQQAQVLRAQLCAAERRAERALRHVELCNDELAAHHPPKVSARGEQPGRTTRPAWRQGGSLACACSFQSRKWLVYPETAQKFAARPCSFHCKGRGARRDARKSVKKWRFDGAPRRRAKMSV